MGAQNRTPFCPNSSSGAGRTHKLQSEIGAHEVALALKGPSIGRHTELDT